MSIFGSIMSAIFGGHPAATASQTDAGTTTSSGGVAPTAASDSDANAAPVQAPVAGVDVVEVLTAKAAQAGQPLDWRNSIVDLMKLLGLDSSLVARKELAGELHYSGDTNDSAGMNVWLHKQVMQKLAENGGKVPDDLKT